jgi:hypothetical protein
MTSTLNLIDGTTLRTSSVHRFQIVASGRIVGRSDSLRTATARAAKLGSYSTDQGRVDEIKAAFAAGTMRTADYTAAMDSIPRLPVAVVYDLDTGAPA